VIVISMSSPDRADNSARAREPLAHSRPHNIAARGAGFVLIAPRGLGQSNRTPEIPKAPSKFFASNSTALLTSALYCPQTHLLEERRPCCLAPVTQQPGAGELGITVQETRIFGPPFPGHHSRYQRPSWEHGKKKLLAILRIGRLRFSHSLPRFQCPASQ